MDQFKVASHLKSMLQAYPAAADVAAAGKHGGAQARYALARLWLSEGIPWAFKECPAVYESMRSWLGVMLGVDPKEVGLTGSARLGSSLSPQKLGQPYGDASDLDLFIVSERLFDQLREEFTNWSFSFESGKVSAHNERELTFWKANNERGPKVIQRGFIDQNMIPNHSAYPITSKISQTMWLVVEKLKRTPGAPRPSKASIRCYSSWLSFVQQISINLQ
ncbi:hypothetical protein SAMN05216379_1335 [Nitrosomonas eutropha]|uniref:hypothetical protein n=1 Tax=Nitrosomonas eutropha TaxID=916 RepID=UPI00088C4357|nr:hypothetical protein [Nitrosomonas eutropha]SCX26721.1 hypothetical protein SAMN05216379_1335 [Nitrosomonas eutropha]